MPLSPYHRARSLCEREKTFLAAHADGYGLYKRRTTVSRIRKQLRNNKRRANKVEIELVEKTALLVSAGVEITKRVAMGVEIKQLADEKAELGLKNSELEWDYATAKQKYEEYRTAVALRRELRRE